MHHYWWRQQERPGKNSQNQTTKVYILWFFGTCIRLAATLVQEIGDERHFCHPINLRHHHHCFGKDNGMMTSDYKRINPFNENGEWKMKNGKGKTIDKSHRKSKCWQEFFLFVFFFRFYDMKIYIRKQTIIGIFSRDFSNISIGGNKKKTRKRKRKIDDDWLFFTGI